MLKVKTKFKIVIGIYSLIPIIALVISLKGSQFFTDPVFQTAISISLLSWLFMTLCSAILPGFKWILLKQIQEIKDLCTDIKNGTYRYFNLPNEPTTAEDENELLALMRTINWMIRKIYSRETDLETSIELRTKELLEINSKLNSAKEAAELSEKVQSEFISTMSREIKKQLNAIIKIAEHMVQTKLDPKQTEFMTILKSSSKSLYNIISNILNFSKIESGNFELDKKPFNPRVTLKELTNMFRNNAKKKNIELILNINKNIPDSIIGDPLRLKQILFNLLSNTLKFTDYGEIVVAVNKVENSDKIDFLISASNINMDKKALSTLFNPFSHEYDHESTNKKSRAIFLGLAISKRLVNHMGGKISILSNHDKGSSFNFTIDYETATVAIPHIDSIPSRLKDSKIITLIKNKTVAKIIDEYIVSFGFNTQNYLTYDKLLNDIERKSDLSPSMMIIDIDLSDNIDKAINRAKKRFPMIHIIKIGLPSKKEITNCDAFLNKPVKQTQLFDTIMNMFESPELTQNQDFLDFKLCPFNTNILIVDDNETNQIIVKEVLKLAGIISKVATSGSSAINLLKKEKFDAVLMDIKLSDMDGDDTAELIKKDSKSKNIPVIAMTANTEKKDSHGFFITKIDDYILKPINSTTLFSVLSKNLKRDIKKINFSSNELEDEHLKGFEYLKGINIKSSLEKVNFNKVMFTNNLIEFTQNYTNSMEEIKTSIKHKNLKKALDLVNSFKEASQNSGAKDLYKNLKKLENEIVRSSREKRFIDLGNEITKCDKEFKLIYSSIKNNEKRMQEDSISNMNMKEFTSISLELGKL